jgi:hypothetical protein
LSFRRALDPDGTAWGSPQVLDSFTGSWNSLGVINGNPAISYYRSGDLDLCYVRALAPDGSSWAPHVTLDSPGNIGAYSSLAMVNGEPAISYGYAGSAPTKFIRHF